MLTPSVSSEGRGIVGLDGSDEDYTREAAHYPKLPSSLQNGVQYAMPK